MVTEGPLVQQLLDLEREWCRRVAARDVDWIVGKFASNGRQFPPGGAIVSGTAALREAWTGLACTDGMELSWEPTQAFVADSEDMAYVYGDARIKSPNGENQQAKYVIVWVKERGEWKIAADIFNANG
jgi:ketosteroid isomerase-like protein